MLQPLTRTDAHEGLRVAVLMGGTSSEREVSLTSGAAVHEALAAAGFQTDAIDLEADALPPGIEAFDVVFPVLHGGFGENGGIQRRFEDAGITYVGSGPSASELMMDKQRTKDILVAAGLPVPRGVRVTREAAGDRIPAGLRPPVVVKPNAGGSSVALSIVENATEWPAAIARCCRDEGDDALVEERLTGAELTVGVIDGSPLTPIEIVPPAAVYDYDAKYTYAHGKTEYLCPPQSLDATATAALRRLAAAAFEAVRARHLARVDFMLDRAGGSPRVLEINSIPGFTATSLLPKAAAHDGLEFGVLCTHLVLAAWAERGYA